jgi:hypothetical protein
MRDRWVPILKRTDEISGDRGEVWAARKSHGKIELRTQDLKDALDAGFSANRQSPKYRPPYQYRPRTISYRFEHVGPTPDSSVNVNLDRAGHRVDDLWQDGNSSRSRV